MNNNEFLQKIESFEAKITKNLENYIEFSNDPLECFIMKNEYKIVLSKYSSKGIDEYFIDNFNDAIKYLKIEGHFELANKEIMEIFLDKNELIKLHNISCVYIFKRKIIIDFNENNCNKSILIIPSHEGYFDYDIILIISNNSKDNEKKELFKTLLNEDINDGYDV